MKKVFILLLIPVFLLTTTVGVTIVSHYCGGKLAERGFSIKPCCADTNKSGCCKTESEIIKIKDAFIKVNHTIDVSIFNAILNAIPEVTFTPSYKEASLSKGYWDKAPPFKEDALYILFHSLII